MIDRDSPLRNIPVALDAKQALFFDGVRHAAELAHLAYERLRHTLTELARKQASGEATSEYTAPFLDAWAVVDAIDRFRALFRLFPGATTVPRADGEPGFLQQTEDIRSIRNVSDHLAQRAEYVVARKGTALGKLSWITVLSEKEFLCCAIIPGTIVNVSATLPDPRGKTLVRPTDGITIEAGEYQASLSDAMAEMRRVIGNIERTLANLIATHPQLQERAPSDVLMSAKVEID